MNNDTALILLLADRQREIESLRTEVARLTEALAEAGGPKPRPAPMSTWDAGGPTGETAQ